MKFFIFFNLLFLFSYSLFSQTFKKQSFLDEKGKQVCEKYTGMIPCKTYVFYENKEYDSCYIYSSRALSLSMNIEEKDDSIMKALKSSDMVVPDFGPTNMGGNKWFDQMAFTQKGKAGNKTRLLRNGTFDWRHAVFGPHPDPNNFPSLPISDEDLIQGKNRLSKQDLLKHYEPIINKLRQEYNKDPYADFNRSYKNWTTYEMSDHLPIWMELEIDYSDEYLKKYL